MTDHALQSPSCPDALVALSFFSGAMGLDLGMAQGGIHARLACEVDNTCRQSIAANFPHLPLIGDITQYSAAQIRAAAGLSPSQEIDVVFGGPPCQAFSTAGARRGLDDARGNVFLCFLDRIADLKPRYVVIENVRGLLSMSYPYVPPQLRSQPELMASPRPVRGGALALILERLRDSGYVLSFELYNAANFGAAQIRERVVIIGKRRDSDSTCKVPYLTPTHDEQGRFGLPHWRTFADAVATIPTTENEQHFLPIPPQRLRFYELLKPGQYWKDLPPELWSEAMGKKLHLGGGKTGFYRRLAFDRPAPTLVTNPVMPATELVHPTANRHLSVEEYRVLQGFAPDYQLCGSIYAQYKQLGNAVPVALGAAIARTLVADMQNKPLPVVPAFPYSRYTHTNDVTWYQRLARDVAAAYPQVHHEATAHVVPAPEHALQQSFLWNGL